MEGLMGWAVLLLTIFFVGIAIVMTGLILLQEGKGGGLAALGGTKAAGIEGVTNPIRRATGYLAAMFFVIAIALSILRKPAPQVDLGNELTSSSAAAVPTTPDSKTETPAESATPAVTEAPKTSASATAPAPISVTPNSVTVPPTTPTPATPSTPAEKK